MLARNKSVQPTLAELGQAVAPMQVPAGTVLFSENSPCQGFPLVLDGEIKVSRSSGFALHSARLMP